MCCFFFLNLQLGECNYFSPCLLFAFCIPPLCAWGMNHVVFHDWRAGMSVLMILCLVYIFGRDMQLLQINNGVNEAKMA